MDNPEISIPAQWIQGMDTLSIPESLENIVCDMCTCCASLQIDVHGAASILSQISATF